MEAAGIPMWKGGDAVDFLELNMRNENLPLNERIAIAKDLAPYQRARKTENVNINDTRYVVALPDGEISMEEWQRRVKPEAEETRH